jgi:FkbM family methyltransferase
MKTIDQHTFDERLLNGRWVIDAGCRGFNFTNYCLDRCNVYALDIEDFSNNEDVSIVRKYFSKLIFKQAALTNYSGQTECYLWGNGYGNFIKGINGEPGSTEDRPVQKITVPAITLQDIYKEIGTDIDLLKLDIEGAEYRVLGEGFEPIPKQITVETHEHCHTDLHNTYWPEIWERLCKDYHASLYISEWPKYKFMDCLFIRKDIL